VGDTYNELERAMTTLWKLPGVFALVFAVFVVGALPAAAVPFCQDPRVPKPGETCNPCAHSSKILGNSLLDAVDEEIKAFITLLGGDVADIDGSFVIDDSGDSLIASLQGDDIRDVSAQFRILEFIMKNPARFPDGSPLSANEVFNAYQTNFDVLRNQKFGDTLAGTLEILIKDIFPFLVYLTLMGKDSDVANIISDDPIVTNGQGALGVLTALVVLLDGTEVNDGLTLNFADNTISNTDFIHFGDELAPDADLDGDGFSNICEWRHFKRNLCLPGFANPAPNVNNSIDYVTAVLDPTITPIGCYVGETPEDDCKVSLSGANVVPPNATAASGEIRYRRFENDETGDVRFQANFFHTVESVAPSARFVRGRVGEAGTQVIRNVADARPTFWEVYLTPAEAAALKDKSNYFEISGLSADTVPVNIAIRGDNNCSGFAPPPPVPHAADLDGNFIIEETEILPLIEYINTGGLRCDGAGGFLSGFGDQNCEPHDSDYNPQDWKINLPELLRLVQLFTAGSYEECIGGSEDGYCIVID
jgi:hypothetical protein